MIQKKYCAEIDQSNIHDLLPGERVKIVEKFLGAALIQFKMYFERSNMLRCQQ